MKSPKIAALLKPVLDKAISETFGVPVADIMNGEKRDFLPRQTALYILKEKYSCNDGQIRKTYGALGSTVTRARECVIRAMQEGGDDAKKVAAVEASLLTETISNIDLMNALEAANNGHSAPPVNGSSAGNNATPAPQARRTYTRRSSVSGSGKFAKKLSAVLQENFLRGVLFASDAESKVSTAKRLFLFLLWNDGQMALADIKAECPGVKDEDIWCAIGWMCVAEREDKAIGDLLESVRKSIK